MRYEPEADVSIRNMREEQAIAQKRTNEREARKKLETAAPELLAACKLAKTILVGMSFMPHSKAMKQIKAAIAKAEKL